MVVTFFEPYNIHTCFDDWLTSKVVNIRMLERIWCWTGVSWASALSLLWCVFVTKEALRHTACCPSLCLVIMLTRCLCLAWTPLCGKPNNRNVGVLTCVTWLQCWLYRYIACVWCCITRDSALLVLQWCWHITFMAFVSCLPYKEIGGVCVKAIILCSTYSTFWDDARYEDSLGEKSSLRLQHG